MKVLYFLGLYCIFFIILPDLSCYFHKLQVYILTVWLGSPLGQLAPLRRRLRFAQTWLAGAVGACFLERVLLLLLLLLRLGALSNLKRTQKGLALVEEVDYSLADDSLTHAQSSVMAITLIYGLPQDLSLPIEWEIKLHFSLVEQSSRHTNQIAFVCPLDARGGEEVTKIKQQPSPVHRRLIANAIIYRPSWHLPPESWPFACHTQPLPVDRRHLEGFPYKCQG